jgi:hypothetical protein
VVLPVDSTLSSPVVASAVAAVPPLRLRRTTVVGSVVHGCGLIGSALLGSRKLLAFTAWTNNKRMEIARERNRRASGSE